VYQPLKQIFFGLLTSANYRMSMTLRHVVKFQEILCLKALIFMAVPRTTAPHKGRAREKHLDYACSVWFVATIALLPKMQGDSMCASKKSRAILLGILWAVLCFGSPIASEAALVTWTLEDVKFKDLIYDDVPTADGSFVYDTSTNSIVDFDVTLRIPVLSNIHFFPSELCPPFFEKCNFATVSPGPVAGAVDILIQRLASSPGGSWRLQLETDGLLTDAGGIVSLVLGENSPDLGLLGSFFVGGGASGTFGILETGVLAASVPEPETFAMVLFGLAVLGVVARSRKRSSANARPHR
jgi:hypothetical protein